MSLPLLESTVGNKEALALTRHGLGAERLVKKNKRLRKLEGVVVPHSKGMRLPTLGKVALLVTVLT